jgi:4-hydroxy-tetrahydrodipicolinate synthase
MKSTQASCGIDSRILWCGSPVDVLETRRHERIRCMKPAYLEGVLPAIVTPFLPDGSIDSAGLESYCRWLGSIPGVTGLVVNGHAGEGTLLTAEERFKTLELVRAAVGDRVKVIASVAGDGSRVMAEEATASAKAGADALLVFPAPSWLRFGYQDGAPKERYEAVHAAAGLPIILFQFPVETRAAYDLHTLLQLCALDGVVAIKDGGRSMIRWDSDVPVIRSAFPDIAILTCQDEFLLHTMWESDGALVGYAALIPELMVELLEKAKSHDYDAAKAVYDRLAPITKAVYHRTSHIESTAAMKIGLVKRGILAHDTVRPPLMPLEDGAYVDIASALDQAGVGPARAPSA